VRLCCLAPHLFSSLFHQATLLGHCHRIWIWRFRERISNGKGRQRCVSAGDWKGESTGGGPEEVGRGGVRMYNVLSLACFLCLFYVFRCGCLRLSECISSGKGRQRCVSAGDWQGESTGGVPEQVGRGELRIYIVLSFVSFFCLFYICICVCLHWNECISS